MSDDVRTSFRYHGCWFFMFEKDGRDHIQAFQDSLRRKTYDKAFHNLSEIGHYLESIFAVKRHGETWKNERTHNPAQSVNTHIANVIATPDWLIFEKSIRETAVAIRDRGEKSWVKKRPGYVYLLQSVSGHYKIGRSVDPSNRLKTFGVLLPFEVEYICLIKTEDCVALEKRLHQMFDDFRVNGEWFNLAADDVEYIKGLAHADNL